MKPDNPDQKSNALLPSSSAPTSISQEEVNALSKRIADMLAQNPEVFNAFSRIPDLNTRTGVRVFNRMAHDISRYQNTVRIFSARFGFKEEDFSIKTKSGAEPGYELINKENQKKYFVKFKQGDSSVKESPKHCVNLFIYKVLENIGFGPKIHILPLPEDQTLALVSEDLTRTEQKDEFSKKYTFTTFDNTDHPSHPNQNSAHDLLVGVLQINDLHGGNQGIVRVEKKTKDDTKVYERQKYKIIDFDKTELNKATSFTGKISQQKETEEMLDRLQNGHKSRPSLAEAIKDAKAYILPLLEEAKIEKDLQTKILDAVDIHSKQMIDNLENISKTMSAQR